jgi:hypothetical protein
VADAIEIDKIGIEFAYRSRSGLELNPKIDKKWYDQECDEYAPTEHIHSLQAERRAEDPFGPTNSEFVAAFQVHSLNETIYAIYGGFAAVRCLPTDSAGFQSEVFQERKGDSALCKQMFLGECRLLGSSESARSGIIGGRNVQRRGTRYSSRNRCQLFRPQKRPLVPAKTVFLPAENVPI